jgi:hypothetical protein
VRRDVVEQAAVDDGLLTLTIGRARQIDALRML